MTAIEYSCTFNLARKIRQFLAESGVSERELSRRCGVSHSTIHDILGGHRFSCRTCTRIMIKMGIERKGKA